MKKYLGFLVALAVAFPMTASAKALNCGWPHPDPGCFITPPEKPVTPGSPQEVQGVLQSLLDVKTTFVNDVNAADAVSTTTFGSPPAMIDPIAHACYPVLASWADGLSLPDTPTPPTGGGLVTVFEEGRVALIIANSVAQQILTTGFPVSLQVACGGLIVNTVTKNGVALGTIASFDALLAKFIPGAILAKHNLHFANQTE